MLSAKAFARRAMLMCDYIAFAVRGGAYKGIYGFRRMLLYAETKQKVPFYKTKKKFYKMCD